MTYNVFGGTLNLAQLNSDLNQSVLCLHALATASSHRLS